LVTHLINTFFNYYYAYFLCVYQIGYTPIGGVSKKINNINGSTKHISRGTEALSSTAQQVNASIEEIASNSIELSQKAKEGDNASKQIQVRALQIKDKGLKAIDMSKKIFVVTALKTVLITLSRYPLENRLKNCGS
jgi:hypothetical protein